MAIDINKGMTVHEIVSFGESEEMYGSLTDGSIDNLVRVFNTDLQNLMGELANAPNEDAKNAIIVEIQSLIEEHKTALETRVQIDLTTQETMKEAADINDAVTAAMPVRTDSPLFSLVASDSMKQIANNFAATSE